MTSHTMRPSVRALRITASLAGAFFVFAAEARAQQSCVVPTAEARASISEYLQEPREQFWLRAHGITATSDAELAVLTDRADGALCAHMDSILAPHHAAYFRAGAYVLGSIAAPIVLGSLVPDLGSPIFVFDSAGNWVHKGGQRLSVPSDLRITSSANGRVVLGWSNHSQDVVGLRLQRASGGGAFVDHGGALAATATSTIDSMTLPGASYRYRLAGAGSAGDSNYSNVVAVSLHDIGTVSQTASGLLFRDQFNRDNGPVGLNWVAESGAWTIANNGLEIPISGSQNAVLRLSAIADRKDFHVQLLSARSNLVNYATLYVRRSGGNMYLADLGSSAEHGGDARLYRQTAGGYALLGYGDTTATANTPYRLTFSVIGTSLRFYADGRRIFSVADATAANNVNGNFALNAYAQGGSGTIRIDDLIVCSSRTVTMTGLPLGYTIRVGAIVSGSATSSGTVSLDLLATPLPVSQIEILNDEDAVVKTHAPANGVCGGDAYALTSP